MSVRACYFKDRDEIRMNRGREKTPTSKSPRRRSLMVGLYCVVKFIYVLIIAPLITLSPLLILRLLCRMFFLCARSAIYTIGREYTDRSDLVFPQRRFKEGESSLSPLRNLSSNVAHLV